MKSVSFNSKNNTFNCLSVIISAYNEQDNIIPLYQKLKKNLDNLQKKRFFTQYEVLFINDGSTDQTEAKIKTICSKNQNVKKISLRKNFGKSTALQAGFFHANGDIITLDADMQDDPDENGLMVYRTIYRGAPVINFRRFIYPYRFPIFFHRPDCQSNC